MQHQDRSDLSLAASGVISNADHCSVTGLFAWVGKRLWLTEATFPVAETAPFRRLLR